MHELKARLIHLQLCPNFGDVYAEAELEYKHWLGETAFTPIPAVFQVYSLCNVDLDCDGWYLFSRLVPT
jgi:hypothetical protein